MKRALKQKVIDRLGKIIADCPKKQVGNMSDQRAARCVDLAANPVWYRIRTMP